MKHPRSRRCALVLLLAACVAAQPAVWACPEEIFTSSATASHIDGCEEAQDLALGIATIRVILAHPGCEVVDSSILSVTFPPPPCDSPGSCSYAGCIAQVTASVTCELCSF